MGYCVTNTLFNKQHRHLVTYESGGNRTAIDMILVKKKHSKTVIDAKAIPGDECVYDHHLVVMDMQLRGSKKRKIQKPNPRIKLWKLKEDKTRQEYLMRLEKSSRGIESSLGVEEQWKTIEKVMTEEATAVCGVTKGRGRQKETWWWCEETEKAVNNKKLKYKEWKRAEESEKQQKKIEYCIAKKEAKKCIAIVQANMMRAQAEKLDSKQGRQEIFRINE